MFVFWGGWWKNFCIFFIYNIILDRPREIGGDGLNWLFGIAGTPMRPAELLAEVPAVGCNRRALLLKFGADLFCLLVTRIFSSSVVSSLRWNDPLKFEFNKLFDEWAPKFIEEVGTRMEVWVGVPPSSITASFMVASCRLKSLTMIIFEWKKIFLGKKLK